LLMFYVFFVYIVVGQTGTYVKFLLLFNNLPMNCKIVCLCFGYQFLLIFGVANFLAFFGCLTLFAWTCFFIQRSSPIAISKGKFSTSSFSIFFVFKFKTLFLS
jgi:hypothetical protein